MGEGSAHLVSSALQTGHQTIIAELGSPTVPAHSGRFWRDGRRGAAAGRAVGGQQAECGGGATSEVGIKVLEGATCPRTCSRDPVDPSRRRSPCKGPGVRRAGRSQLRRVCAGCRLLQPVCREPLLSLVTFPLARCVAAWASPSGQTLGAGWGHFLLEIGSGQASPAATFKDSCGPGACVPGPGDAGVFLMISQPQGPEERSRGLNPLKVRPVFTDKIQPQSLLP